MVSLLQAIVKPRKYYINQVINRGDKNAFHTMVNHSFKAYCDQGGKYAYAWIDPMNIASQRFHMRYGFVLDGMVTQIYQRL